MGLNNARFETLQVHAGQVVDQTTPPEQCRYIRLHPMCLRMPRMALIYSDLKVREYLYPSDESNHRCIRKRIAASKAELLLCNLFQTIGSVYRIE